MPDDLRPIAGDPSREMVQAMLDVSQDEWWLADGGDVEMSAGESMLDDGTDYQLAVLFQIPTRLNHTQTRRLTRVVIAPEDAIQLAQGLAHAALVAMEARRGS